MEIQSGQVPPAHPRHAQIMDVAKALEASFLEEMLKSAGLGKTPEGFGGGAGEDQFSSFLRSEQAKLMTEAGGIGLAKSLFDAIVRTSNETTPS